jgi:chemosensory pili system protein ChpA (sensor histidine kinase/response regulator)
MITSRNSDKHRQLAQQAGVDHYLCKPFAEDELQACIDKCFDNSPAAKTEAATRKYVEDQTA